MAQFLKHFVQFLKSIRAFLVKNPLDLFPLRHTFKELSFSVLKADFSASFNVFLLAIPQGMAYAAIANVPIVYGIISSGVAALVAPLFSSSRYTNLGPTNATALMLFSYFALSGLSEEEKLIQIPLLIFLIGIFVTLGAVCRLADLLQYVSRSVLVGYITGAASIIMVNQLKHFFGIAEYIDSSKIGSLFSLFGEIVQNIHYTSWQTFAIAAVSLALYLFLSKMFPKLPIFGIVLIVVSAVAFACRLYFPELEFDSVAWFSDISLSSLAPVIPWSTGGSLLEMIRSLFPIALALSFLASLENTVMSKNLATQSGTKADVNQDMFSLGLSNIACSFIGGMPASASLTRSALNFSSGARTAFSSLFCGILSLVAVYFLAKFGLISKIPKACLSALVIGVALSLIKWKNIRVCLQATRDDAIVIVVTFLSTMLVPLHSAIFIGVVLSLVLFLRKVSKPTLIEYEFSEDGDLREKQKQEQQTPSISIVHVEGSLYFGAAELFRNQIERVAVDPNLKAIVLRMKNARHLDATSVLALRDLIVYVRTHDCHVLLSGLSKDIYKILKRSGVIETIQEGCDRSEGETNIFMHLPSNPNVSTRDALIRAQGLLGTKEAEIKIYFDPSEKKES